MSKIEELINQKCPDGVEYKKLGALCEKIKNVVWDEKSRYYIDLSAVSIELRSILENGVVQITKDSAPSRAKQVVKGSDILFGGTRPMQGRICMVPDKYEGYVASTGFNIVRIKDKAILNKYVYYCMNSRNFYDFIESVQHGASYPAINDSEMKEYEIPVPPIEVQEEIVRILDKFTEITAELKENLTDELTARQQQYEYYRDELLTFGDDVDCYELLLGDIFDFQYGKGNNIPNDGGKYPVYGGNGICGWCSEYNSEDAPVIGHIGAYAGLVKWATGKHFVTYNGVICSHKNVLVNKRFAYYLLLVQDFLSEQKGAQPFVSYDALKKPIVRVPKSITEQERIVEILDSFYAFSNDIIAGLSAEIEARQQQYEYYRDKLLTFERKVV